MNVFTLSTFSISFDHALNCAAESAFAEKKEKKFDDKYLDDMNCENQNNVYKTKRLSMLGRLTI